MIPPRKWCPPRRQAVAAILVAVIALAALPVYPLASPTLAICAFVVLLWR